MTTYLFIILFITLCFEAVVADNLRHRKLQPTPLDPIEGSYIIELIDGFRPEEGASAMLNGMQNVHVPFTYTHTFNGFTVWNFPAQHLNGILDHPNVTSVFHNARVYASEVVEYNVKNWGIDRIDSPSGLDGEYHYEYDGSGVDAYILDTPIYNHIDFEGRLAACVSFHTQSCTDPITTGHGTHVAGIVGSKTYGVAKNVQIHSVIVLGNNGIGSWDQIISGLEYITMIKKNNPSKKMVANLSLGAGGYSLVDRAVANAVSAGIVVSVAAGNGFGLDACRFSPAREASAITVGSVTKYDSRAPHSNDGSCVDIFAPGVGITSTVTNNGIAAYSGTSMATPHVTGVAALYLQAGKSASNLISDATTNIVGDAGTGSPNRLLYSGRLLTA